MISIANRLTVDPDGTPRFKISGRRYRAKNRVEIDGITIFWRKSALRPLCLDYAIKYARIDIAAFRGSQHIGYFLLYEFHPRCGVSNERFIDTLDNYSAVHWELASALASRFQEISWETLEGPILEFHTAKVYEGRTSTVTRKKVVEVIAQKISCPSMIIAKAWPFGYERGSRTFSKKKDAMIRYYENLLGLRPLPGNWGERGWLLNRPDEDQFYPEASDFQGHQTQQLTSSSI